VHRVLGRVDGSTVAYDVLGQGNRDGRFGARSLRGFAVRGCERLLLLLGDVCARFGARGSERVVARGLVGLERHMEGLIGAVMVENPQQRDKVVVPTEPESIDNASEAGGGAKERRARVDDAHELGACSLYVVMRRDDGNDHRRLQIGELRAQLSEGGVHGASG